MFIIMSLFHLHSFVSENNVVSIRVSQNARFHFQSHKHSNQAEHSLFKNSKTYLRVVFKKQTRSARISSAADWMHFFPSPSPLNIYFLFLFYQYIPEYIILQSSGDRPKSAKGYFLLFSLKKMERNACLHSKFRKQPTWRRRLIFKIR